MMTERLNLTVEEGIGEMLVDLAGSRNKMGESVSKLVRAAHTADEIPASTDVEVLRLMVLGLSSEMKLMKRKLNEAHEYVIWETANNQARLSFLMEKLGLSEDDQVSVIEVTARPSDYGIFDFKQVDKPFPDIA